MVFYPTHILFRCCRTVWLLILLLAAPTFIFAQKDSTLPVVTVAATTIPNYNGTISGKVKDSTYNFMLTSATVAVYKDTDSSILQYTLPNNFGEFSVASLPVNIPLRLIITHVGYRDLLRKFTLQPGTPSVDFGLLYLWQLARDSSGELMEEVVVKAVPPMRMNGDTLEFNFDAFRADPNATVEDQIRRLPGMVIWGDGEITFNGKKINALLVDGKPFMGTSDITVATQNLPKDAIEKLQVYQQRDEKNPLDSTLLANLKLKDDKKLGYFGKTSVGYGHGVDKQGRQLYAADGMVSGFNKKMQIATVASANNVNKVANGVDALIRNASYKGEGIALEYQSDFNMRGINKPVMGGARFQYDFIPDVQYRKSSRLNADYFINHNNTQTINTNLEKRFISADTILSRQAGSSSVNRSDAQRASSRYERSAERYSFELSAAASANEDESKNSSTSVQEKTGIGIVNKSSAENSNYNNAKNLQAGFSFTNREGDYYNDRNKKRLPSEFTIKYNLNTGENTGHSQSTTRYEFAKEPQRNRNVSRLYDRQDGNNTGHHFEASYPRFRELLFGKRSLGGIDIELSAKYNLGTTRNNNQVRDLDTVSGTYVSNTGLSYNRTVVTKDFMPALQLSKYFYKGLTNRYNKYVSINLNAVQQYYNYASNSTQLIQNLQNHYQRFVPNGSVEYNNHQYGSYEANYRLSYTTNVTYPNINLWAPLVDLSNPLYLPVANNNLKPEYRQNLGFKYEFTTRTPKNPWNIDAGITVGKTEDNMVDSTLYDNGGGRTVYMVNINGNKYLNSNIDIRKALAANKYNTFEFGIRFQYNVSNDPRYIDTKLNTSINRNQGGNLSFNYRHKDKLNIKLEQNLSYYDAEQRGLNNSRFKSNNVYSRAIATLQLPNNLLWSSNITYNRSVAGNTDAINFTIWNASLAYRFLKADNGEIKFSALDLLRQNKGITNTANGNVQNFGTTNVLKQYYMLTLSYYPRKFGKGK